MTPFQLEESANAPCSRTIVGFFGAEQAVALETSVTVVHN